MGIGTLEAMSVEEANFLDYKRAEGKALQIMREMRAASAKPVDIEVALLTALFELHRGILPAATVAKIVSGHLQTLVPFYEQGELSAPDAAETLN